MMNPEELKDLGRTLALTVGRLLDAGIKVRVRGFEDGISIDLVPFTICDTCNRWSPADKCLWCEEE